MILVAILIYFTVSWTGLRVPRPNLHASEKVQQTWKQHAFTDAAEP